MSHHLGLIGFPLHYSRSPEWFEEAFRRFGRTGCRYELYPISTIDALPDLLEQHPSISGLNVTIPYKEQVMRFVDVIDPAAAAIGAVNTLLIRMENEKRRIQGFNTDAEGFIRSADFSPYSRALILGTGGAAKAIAYALNRSGKQVTFVSRHAGARGTLSYSSVTRDVIHDHHLIINATPLGMEPCSDLAPEIPYQFLTHRHFLYDVVYAHADTAFIKHGKAHGAHTQSGLRMLFCQAEASFTLFFQVPAL